MIVSCQKQEPAASRMASVAFYLENAPAGGDVATRTVMPKVDVDEFTVAMVSGQNLMTGTGSSYSYKYGDIVANDNMVSVEIGIYTVTAENVTEEESLSAPTAWGQPRYYAKSSPTPVFAPSEETDEPAVRFNLKCRMVNSAVHVDFDPSVADVFESYRVSVYTDEERRFEYNEYNTTEEYNPTAYFSPKTLYYMFSGTVKGNSYHYTMSGTVGLEAATNHFLNFRIDGIPGEFGFGITVDTSYELVYEPVFIEPDFSQN